VTTESKARILFVDDEPLVLSGLRRGLAGEYVFETAPSGAEGLVLLEQSVETEPFAVVVSDMMMPGMNGAEFLRRARLVEPDAVLIILSGQADLSSTVAAVNNANLFRFLTKPCSSDDLRRALNDALRHHQLVMAERELLERTLFGAVEVLTKVLSIANPEAFGRSDRVASLVEAAAQRLGHRSGWELRLASRLSHIGCIAVPETILESLRYGAGLDADDQLIYESHPAIAADLLAGIPRLGRVAAWIGSQPVRLSGVSLGAVGSDEAGSSAGGEFAVMDRTILHAAIACLAARDAGVEAGQFGRALAKWFPQPVLAALSAAAGAAETEGAAREVGLDELRMGMLLQRDVLTSTGMMLVRSGERISPTLLLRLRNFARSVGIDEPLRVIVPTTPYIFDLDALDA
jgi:CheY-like chemotaxis protein